MSNATITTLILAIVGVIVFLWLLNRLYLKGASDRAYVRTGLGGRKVALDGGMLVLPIVHQVRQVHLGLSRVNLKAEADNALITADRMRVDVEVEIFLKVRAQAESVGRAATSLGELVNRPDALAEFFESAFLGAFRAVAAEHTLTGLHENRSGFIKQIQEKIEPILSNNGLELDSVAIRNLDQTALEYFNPANSFDAQGLTELIQTVEDRRQMRNEIEQKSAVAIREANLNAEKQTLKLDRESQVAKIEQEHEIETMRAANSAKIAKAQSESNAEAEAARIEASQSINQRDIFSREEVERARLSSERALDESRVLREQELRRLEIEREKFIDLAKIEKGLAVLKKSIEEADAQVKAEKQLTAAANSKEVVSKARELGAAERVAAVAIVDTECEMNSEKLRASVLAEAERLHNEAENLLTEDARAGRLRGQLIAKLETIVEATVKPIEKIGGIKMVHMSGGGEKGGGRSPTDEVIDSALRYRVQAPMIDELMKEIGVEGANISKMGDVFRAAKDAQSIGKDIDKKEKGND